MTRHPFAGARPTENQLVDIVQLRDEYYSRRPDPAAAAERVRFGISGHRGSSHDGRFTEAHVLAITQAICDYRRIQGIGGPLFIGRDTHALSEVGLMTAVEVLAANGVEIMLDRHDGFTPTPAISHAILAHNRTRVSGLADGIVMTPSHNPPEDGGFKYNPPTGGPADTAVSQWIERRANELLSRGHATAARIPYHRARRAGTTRDYDYLRRYVDDLGSVVDMAAIRYAGFKVGVDPLGGASLGLWQPIAERYRIAIDVVNDGVDQTFGFVPLDRDGRIRMDCSSPFAMARLIGLKDRYDIAFGNDPDSGRHGVVTRSAGLMQPNHYLTAAIHYLFTHRAEWQPFVAIGKTVVGSSMIDRVAARLECRLVEMPVGFTWFVSGLLEGTLGFAGEESAGASFLRHDGTVWTTDKDGIIMDLLALELMARTGRDPSETYEALTREFGDATYERLDVPTTSGERRVLMSLSPEDVAVTALAGDPIRSSVSLAPGNGAPIGGLKVATAYGWFVVRPSGTEDVYRLYAESFRGHDHLRRIQDDAQSLIRAALAAAAGRC